MTRAPVTLSREMKILLTALGLVALLGGWLVWNNQKQAETAVVTPPPVTTPKDGQTGQSTQTGQGTQTPDAKAPNTKAPDAATGSGGETTSDPAVPVAPVTAVTDGKTEVATVPPFPVTDPNGSTPDPTVLVPVPSGINPNQPLNGLNGHNPFRPIRVEADKANGAAPVAQAPASSAPEAGPVTIQRPTSTQAQIDAALNTPAAQGGALPLPQIPTTTAVVPAPAPTASTSGASKTPTTSSSSTRGGTTGSNGVKVTQSGMTVTFDASGALPIPRIPGTNVSGQAPTTTVKVPAAGQKGSTTGAPTAVAPAPVAPTPIAPPVTGVQEPKMSLPTTAAVTAAGGASGAAGKNAGSTSAGGSGSNPQVITSIQTAPTPAAPSPAGAPVTDEPSAPAVVENKAETAISDHQLVFDAAVLGPVNTAVFRSSNGFVVASVGQPIPNTNLILKEVTATTATLVAGKDSKTLQLDKR